MNIKIPENGIVKTPEDTRDFSLAGTFQQIKKEEVPLQDFETRKPLIKDQKDSDFCSSYTVTSVSEDQELVELVPEFQFYVTKVLISKDPDSWGANLRDACLSAVKYGSLPRYVVDQGYRIPADRDLVLNKDTWLDDWFRTALAYKKASLFKVDGRYDTFDNIRCALWQFRDEKRSLAVGAEWREEWTEAKGGIIPKEEFKKKGFGHAFKIYGQKMIHGEPYLKAQLSNSTDIGDDGVYYFPREVVNREFTDYGQFMFKDISRETVDVYKTQGIKATDNIFSRLFAFIRHFLGIK